MIDFITTYFGEWVMDYPYTLGAIMIVIFIFVCITLQNLLYQLVKLITGAKD